MGGLLAPYPSVWFIPHRISCLPGSAHLAFLFQTTTLIKQDAEPTDLEFENQARKKIPETANHFFTPWNTLTNASYPAGNFGENQLLNSSIGLSLRYVALGNDLHVSNPSGLHLAFARLCRDHA